MFSKQISPGKLEQIYYLDEISSTILNDVVFDMRTKYTFELNICVRSNKHVHEEIISNVCINFVDTEKAKTDAKLFDVSIKLRKIDTHDFTPNTVSNRTERQWTPVLCNGLISHIHCAKKDPQIDVSCGNAKLQSHRVCVCIICPFSFANMISRFPCEDGSFQFFECRRILFLDINRASSFLIFKRIFWLRKSGKSYGFSACDLYTM